MRYFAYGSNMDPQRMKEREIGFSERIPAVLKGYSLKFNKVSVHNPRKCFANIVADAKGTVEGVLYEIPDADLEKLDECEGYPKEYDHLKIKVSTATGEKEAIAYIACPDKIKEGLKPDKEYIAHLLAAKDTLSEEYYRKIESVQTLN